tara:strand:- start:64 stop:960 length:897 start_codon:yes stop_codon:yes gene_type:complete
MACKIINNSGLEISGFEDMIQSLVSFSQDRFGFEKPPSLFLNSDPANAENMLGKTAYYDPQQKEIHIYTTDRHPKDIMRSISHELVHHHQNCKGDFAGDHYSGEGYAQKDPHMRKMEQEAYLQGNMCFRDWEDGYKQKQQVYNEWRTNTMSLNEWKNKELFDLLSQRWGFSKNVITEAKGEKGDADPLDGERKKFDKDLDGIPDGGDPNPDDPDNPDAKKKLDEAEVELQVDAPNAGATMTDISEEKIEEEQLDEDEVEESVRGYRKENEPQHSSQGGSRVSDRLRESIYDRFRKLIK